MSITYGIQVKDNHDPYIETVEHGLDALAAASIPGAFLVDTFPILKYVPRWMPGASFKRKAEEWKELGRRIVEEPFEAAKRNMVSGSHHVNTCSFAVNLFLF